MNIFIATMTTCFLTPYVCTYTNIKMSFVTELMTLLAKLNRCTDKFTYTMNLMREWCTHITQKDTPLLADVGVPMKNYAFYLVHCKGMQANVSANL